MTVVVLLSIAVGSVALLIAKYKTVRDVLPAHLLNVPAANADDTIIEVAALMARLRSPLIAVRRRLGINMPRLPVGRSWLWALIIRR